MVGGWCLDESADNIVYFEHVYSVVPQSDRLAMYMSQSKFHDVDVACKPGVKQMRIQKNTSQYVSVSSLRFQLTFEMCRDTCVLWMLLACAQGLMSF